MNEHGEDREAKGRNPLNGVAIIVGLLCMTFGIVDSRDFLIAGAILFSGGLISYSVQESRR